MSLGRISGKNQHYLSGSFGITFFFFLVQDRVFFLLIKYFVSFIIRFLPKFWCLNYWVLLDENIFFKRGKGFCSIIILKKKIIPVYAK